MKNTARRAPVGETRRGVEPVLNPARVPWNVNTLLKQSLRYRSTNYQAGGFGSVDGETLGPANRWGGGVSSKRPIIRVRVYTGCPKTRNCSKILVESRASSILTTNRRDVVLKRLWRPPYCGLSAGKYHTELGPNRNRVVLAYIRTRAGRRFVVKVSVLIGSVWIRTRLSG